MIKIHTHARTHIKQNNITIKQKPIWLHTIKVASRYDTNQKERREKRKIYITNYHAVKVCYLYFDTWSRIVARTHTRTHLAQPFSTVIMCFLRMCGGGGADEWW